MNGIAWYLREKKEYYTARSRKEHTLLTCTCPSSSLGPYRPQTHLNITVRDSDITQLLWSTTSADLSLCMQLTFIYFGQH